MVWFASILTTVVKHTLQISRANLRILHPMYTWSHVPSLFTHTHTCTHVHTLQYKQKKPRLRLIQQTAAYRRLRVTCPQDTCTCTCTCTLSTCSYTRTCIHSTCTDHSTHAVVLCYYTILYYDNHACVCRPVGAVVICLGTVWR